MKKKINISVPDIVGKSSVFRPLISSKQESRSNPSSGASSHPNLRGQSWVLPPQTNIPLAESIAKGYRFENLLSIAKKQKQLKNGESEGAMQRSYAVSRKCTPQNTGRGGITDHYKQVLHRSLERLKEEIIEEKSHSSVRVNSAPKKGKQINNSIIKKTSQQNVKSQSKQKLNNITCQSTLNTPEDYPISSYQNYSLSSSKDPFSKQFGRVISTLDHENHAHIRQSECFMSEAQLQYVLIQMHFIRADYNKIKGQKIDNGEQSSYLRNKFCIKMFKELGGSIYGGIVSGNVEGLLRAVEGEKGKKQNLNSNNISITGEKTVDHSYYIDENLKLAITEKQKKTIYNQYFPLRTSRILWLSQKVGKEHSRLSLNSNHRNTIQYKNVASYTLRNDDKQYQNQKNQLRIRNLKSSQNKEQILYDRKNIQNNNLLKAQDNSTFLNKHPPAKQVKKTNQLLQIPTPFCNKKAEQTELQYQKKIKSQSVKLQTQREYHGNLGQQLAKEDLECLGVDVQSKKRAILSVDVNLGEGVTEKIIVYEGQSSAHVANRLSERFKIDQSMKIKFEKMLQSHIRSLLWKIEEVSEELISDRQ